MSVHIVDDEQHSDRPATPTRLGRCADPDPFGFRLGGGICGVGAPRGEFRAPLKDEDFIVVVGGGPGVWMAAFKSSGGFENSFVTKKIELPRNWDKLVAKYKALVPNYENY